MKNMSKYLFAAFVLVMAMASCKKDENKIYYEGGTAPQLTASSAGPLVFNRFIADNPAVTFKWTNPDYKFTTGVSSQNVSYLLQVDTTDKFTSAAKQEISIANDLSKSFTVKELNTVLSKMNLTEDVASNVYFRVRASLAGGTVPLLSNTIKMVITPYLDAAVPVPTNGTLWIVGDATNNGWSNPLSSPYDVSQKFTRVSSTVYEITVPFKGGGAYKLIQENGVWGSQYHMISGGTWESGEFEKKDADPGFPGPPTAGNYKITVNFKTGKYTVVKI